MNLIIILDWAGYVLLGAMIVMVFVVCPIALIKIRLEDTHIRERTIEQETVGYREEPIE